jgi:hypothetical protein
MASQILASENGKKFLEEFLKNGWVLDAQMMSKNQNPKWIQTEDIEKFNADIEKAKTIEDLMG